jgi:DNA-binding MarR family transcriptional regulator
MAAKKRPEGFIPEDSVDALLESWRGQRPDLDFAPIGVITRLGRLRGHLDTAIEAVFAPYGLGSSDFAVLVTLARIGDESGISQRRLMDELGLTSGTISVRMDRLVEEGLVERRPDPESKRTTLITLTAHGRDVFERVVPAHLDNERRLLAALTDDERALLAGLLRTLLVEFEGSTAAPAGSARLGLTLAPAHVAISMRESVGLPPTPGLLVRTVDQAGPAAAAGIRTGDVLRSVGNRELRCVAALHTAIGEATTTQGVQITLLRGLNEQRVTVRLTDSARPRAAPPTVGGRTTRGEHHV